MKKPGTVKVTRSGETAKLVPFTTRLLNITNRKELQKQCNELGIPIGDVDPDIMKKIAMDEKSHFCHAVETKK